MNDRERMTAVLNYQPYDRLPIVHFGFWHETLARWAAEGHLTPEAARAWGDGDPTDAAISAQLGFDFNYYACFHPHFRLRPGFEPKVLREFPDGARHVLNSDGVVILQSPGASGIPAEIEHLFKGRKEWEELYRPRFQFCRERVSAGRVRANDQMLRFEPDGIEFLKRDDRTYWYGLHCGSLYGQIRDFIGLENTAYLYADDEALFDEIIGTVGELCYQCTKLALASGARFDFAHFWEDICYRGGPLISPAVFAAKVGPHYRRITDLVRAAGIEIVSLDCDGCIDALIPTWLENGVNTMFPIEVGTWQASIEPWRKRFGKQLRGVGGLNKTIFAADRAAVDREIERLRPLIELGGFVPCPDHRLPPDAKWDNVRYYCDRMRRLFA